MTRTFPAFRGVAATIGVLTTVIVMTATAGAQVLRAGNDGETFDVASIKPAPRPRVPVPEVLPGGVFQTSGVTLSDLIRFAYPTPNGQGCRADVACRAAGATRAEDRADERHDRRRRHRERCEARR